MNLDDFRAYQNDGLLRSDLRYTRDLRRAQWAIINHQREYREHEYDVWALTGDARPRQVLAVDGVPLASLYRLRMRPRNAGPLGNNAATPP